MRIQLPVADAISMERGAQVQAFLNIAPLRPLDAVLDFASYEPIVAQDGHAAYRLRARFDAAEVPPSEIRFSTHTVRSISW